MLVNLNQMLQDAYQGGYAVGSYNVYNYETIAGVIAAAKELQTPHIVAFGEKYLQNMPLKAVVALTQALSDEADVPICLHLDHCTSVDTCLAAIEAGFTSIMYDGSALPFAQNMANTAQVVKAAHAKGVTVEAELGSLAAGAQSHEGSESDVEQFTDPAQAAEFVKETGVDALAVSIGTVHGLYKGEPNVRIDILKNINDAVHIPLVLHGGSGTPEAVLQEATRNGIAKVNVNTEISANAVANTRETLEAANPHLSELSLKQIGWVKDTVSKYTNMYAR